MVLGVPDLLKQICDFVKRTKKVSILVFREEDIGVRIMAWERHTVHDDCTKHL